MKKHKQKIAIISVGIIGIFLLFSSANLSAQNVAVTDDETYTADPSAMLDVKSDSKGLLIPRLTTTQRNGISNPAHGLLVYDSDEKVFYYFDGSSWVNLSLGQAWEINSNYVYLSSDNGRVGIGTSAPNSKLEVKADNTFTENDTLFAVKDQNGNIVFAVFPDGAKVYVNSGTKGKIGGFAVSGRTSTKAEETEYLRVTPDSTRIYVNEDATKGKIGGFAVSGRTSTKGLVNDYLLVGSDSTRIYVKEDATKGKIGGFAVSGRTSTKGSFNDYLQVTKDSTRVYISESESKGKIGGFAVSGRTSTKGIANDYFNISGNTDAEVIDNESRVIWYPQKAALLAGEVHVGSADSVGKNSTALGYRTIAMGEQSQSFGYQTKAFGDYSTAIGRNAQADGNSSFAFGEDAIAEGMNSFSLGQWAHASNDESYAFGRGAIAEGFRSFAFGSAGVDSIGDPTGVAHAKGDYTFAIGQGSQALGHGSFAIGLADTAKGSYSLAMGYKTAAIGFGSTAIGYETSASGSYSTAMGFITTASGYFSTAMGNKTSASGSSSTAMGAKTTASGVISTAMGHRTSASGERSTSMGYETIASGFTSTAMGHSTSASGSSSTAMGSSSTASGVISTAMGEYTIASGSSSTAMGYETTASGDFSTAMGYSTSASRTSSTAMGYETEASGMISTAMGHKTTASGGSSTAMGGKTTASGSSSTAMGYETTASGIYSTAMGQYTIARPYNSFIIGRFNDTTASSLTNWTATDPLFVIGNGSADNSRSNAVTVLKNGNVGIGPISPSYKLQLDGAIMLSDISTPSNLTGHSGIYSNSGELFAIDELGNSTVLSPHNFSLIEKSEPMAWSFYSENKNIGYKINVDMLKAIRVIEKLSGEKLVFMQDLESGETVNQNYEEFLIDIIDQQNNKIEKEFFKTASKDDGGYLSLDKSSVIPILSGAIQEQQKKINKLEKENSELLKRLDRIEEMLTK